MDLSSRALEYAAGNAERSAVSDRITFTQYDLTKGFPEGEFDLIVASFLESPLAFDRRSIFRAAFAHVAPGGMLLITLPRQAAVMVKSMPIVHSQSAKEAIASLEPLPEGWEIVFCDDVSRTMRGPEGEKGEVSDSVIALRRK
ncbi:Methylase of polypeptide chain release factors [Raoultella terrigena]|uniref:Methylase of polypeptide chain release factors n=1 Tax=Raoultella terrigena TaxID=577 RepID=A0A3P8J935_RAOTE|nr:Methylase of polypeptide chain release factors [Raoultella terrigena]